MCPDHFSIYNTEEMLEFANNNGSGLLIVETAGLCHRCAPYTKNSLGVCVIDATTGPNTPRKVGPFLSTADIVAITKGDIISQAEREIFRERILEMNPNCRVIEVNGLSGKGAFELSELFLKSPELQLEKETLRHNAPFAICTLCVGETKVTQKVHRGLLRRFDGFFKLQRRIGMENLKKLSNLLPGFNCSSCGYKRCDEFASALIEKDLNITLCPFISQPQFEQK